MPDFLSEAEWKKNVNKLLGLIHGKTGISEALKAYAAIRNRNGATVDDKKEALETIIEKVEKTKTAHKSKPDTVKYLTAMIKAANEEIEGWTSTPAGDSGPLPNVAFTAVLGNAKMRKYFMDFLNSEFSPENLQFYMICTQLDSANYTLLSNVYRQWVATTNINLPGTITGPMKHVVDGTVEGTGDNAVTWSTKPEPDKVQRLRELFSQAKVNILRLMKQDSFVRFKTSPFYRKMANEVSA
jgi:Regulator of G protein signaling domain